LTGVGVTALIAFLSFRFLLPLETEIATLYGANVEVKKSKHLTWYTYSPDLLEKAAADGKTVMIDFTADWCPTCQTNFMFAIDKQQVGELVKEHGVLPLLADLSKPSETINAKLAELRAAAIPILAIYPAGRPDHPIILQDVISEEQLVAALKSAVPANASAAEPRTAMNTAGAE
jgi:thiol:disulfide interchange protein